jgi:ABC-2 type transport system permease protein
MPVRRGRAKAKPGFKTPLALSWRLQRGMAFSWIIGYAAAGALMGSLIVTIESMFKDISSMANWINGLGGNGKAFVYFLIYILIQVVTAYAIIATLRLRSEENEMRAEPILANSVSKTEWASSHLVFTFLGTAMIVAAMGIGAGVTASIVLKDSSMFINIFSFCIVKLPAVWFVASITVFLIGVVPNLAAIISWTLMGFFFAVEFLWELKIVGDEVFRLSPFSYVYPTNSIVATPMVILTFLAIIFTIAGVSGLKQREIGH